MTRFFFFIAFVLCAASLSAQKLIPYVGIEGDSITINQSTIDDVVRLKGKPDSIYNEYTYTVYQYKARGVGYRYDYYDASRIIRSVKVTTPFEGCSTHGVCLGVTSWRGMELLLEIPGGHASSDVVCRSEDGIAYYIRRKGLKTWDTAERIFMIVLDSYDRRGIKTTFPGFVYDTTGEAEQISRLTEFIQQKRSLQSFNDSFPEDGKRDAQQPYKIRRSYTRQRALECGQYETRTVFACGKSDYELVLFSRNDTIYSASLQWEHDPFEPVLSDPAFISSLNQHYQRIYPGLHDSTLARLHDPESDYYSQGCGESLYCNEWCKATEKMMLAKDTAQLYQWLCCGIPEKQAFALFSLWELQSNGTPLSAHLLSTMLHVAQLKTTVYVCRGCVTNQPGTFDDVVRARSIKRAIRG